MMLLLLLACVDSAYDYPTRDRELWRGQVGGTELTASAQLNGWHRPAGPAPEFRVREATDNWVIEVALKTDLVVRNAGDLRAVSGPLFEQAAADTALAGLTSTFCPRDDALVYRAGERDWTALWPLAGELVHAPLPQSATDCASLEVPTVEDWLAEHAGGATFCRLLDDAGHRDHAVRCLLLAPDWDRPPYEPPPASGPRAELAREVTRKDAEELKRRLAEDPASLDAVEAHALEHGGEAALGLLEEAGRIEAFTDRALARCADPDEPCEALPIVRTALRGNCEAGAAAVEAVRARGGEAGLRAGFELGRGMFACDAPALRTLWLDGLDVATEPDRTLKSPDAIAYGGHAPDCRAYLAGGEPDVSALCGSMPRFAGSWLAAHCGPDAVERARAVVAARPKEPFDPREDQVLDGALRVLGKCDAEAFEAAIAHVPETATAMANVRSKENLRKAFTE